MVKNISVTTQKLSIGTLEKRSNSKEFKFPSKLKLSKNESNMVDCNVFFEDFDEHNVAK